MASTPLHTYIYLVMPALPLSALVNCVCACIFPVFCCVRVDVTDVAPGTYLLCIEVNSAIVRLTSRRLDAYSGFSKIPGFELHNDEGRSFLSKPGGGTQLGEKIFADGVTLRSNPFDPRNPAMPWVAGGFRGGPGSGSAGLPVRKTTWIENGVVKTLAVFSKLGSKCRKAGQ